MADYSKGLLESEIKLPILSIFVMDNVVAKARVTFDSEMFQGMKVVYWMGDEGDTVQRIENIFDILFEEVLKTRNVMEMEEIKNKINNV